MFNVDNAFSAKNKWFSFGFSKRGDLVHSDICFFTKENDIFDVAVVSKRAVNFVWISKINWFTYVGHVYRR